jgi:hypothetical protein
MKHCLEVSFIIIQETPKKFQKYLWNKNSFKKDIIIIYLFIFICKFEL